MSRHSFDPEIAAKVGLNAAVIYQNIIWWCEKNAANGKNIHDGKAWTYNSMSSFEKLFKYLTKRQIRHALAKLREAGLIDVGNFNNDPRDQTNWYAKNETLQMTNLANGGDKNVRPLPVSKPDNKHTPIPPKGADLFSENPEEKIDGSFEEFWNAYPKKAGKDAARRAWAKAVKKAQPSEIIEGAKRYAIWLNSADDAEFRPPPKYPQGWLNAGRWADEDLWAAAPQQVKPETYARQVMREYGVEPPLRAAAGPPKRPETYAQQVLREYGC